jgi:hypothetical protein
MDSAWKGQTTTDRRGHKVFAGGSSAGDRGTGTRSSAGAGFCDGIVLDFVKATLYDSSSISVKRKIMQNQPPVKLGSRPLSDITAGCKGRATRKGRSAFCVLHAASQPAQVPLSLLARYSHLRNSMPSSAKSQTARRLTQTVPLAPQGKPKLVFQSMGWLGTISRQTRKNIPASPGKAACSLV